MNKNKRVINALLGSVLCAAGTPVAEAATDKAKDAKIEALEKRLQELEERLLNGSAIQPVKTPVQESINKLDQQVKIIQRQKELDKDAAVEAAKKVPKFEIGRKGISFESPEKDFSLRIRGLVQAHSRFFHDDSNNPNYNATTNPTGDSFELRRGRIGLTGNLYKDFNYVLLTEFGGATPQLVDAYVNYKYTPELQLRAGRFLVPFGFEQFQSASNLTFVERSLANNLAPNRDNGFELTGDIGKGLFEYQAGVGNGTYDNENAVATDANDQKEFFGRVFGAPFSKSGVAALENLRVGVSGTYGEQAAAPLAQSYTTAGRQAFFKYNAATNGNGERHRFSPHLFYSLGSLGLQGEYTLSTQDVKRATNAKTLDNTGWVVAASYILTGEKLKFSSTSPDWNTGIGINPDNDFDPRHNKWGAFQIAARYNQLNVDKNAFIGGIKNSANWLADATAARNAESWEVGLNWYLNSNLSATVDYAQTRFSGGAARDTENVVQSRVQLAF